MASKFQEEAQQTVRYDDKEYEVVKEGLAEILNARNGEMAKSTEAHQTVFYNPIQQFNRDLSVLAIRAFGEDLAIIRKARHQRRLNERDKQMKKQIHEEPAGKVATLERSVENSELKSEVSGKDKRGDSQESPHENGVGLGCNTSSAKATACSVPSKVDEVGNQQSTGDIQNGIKRKIDMVEEVDYPTSKKADIGNSHTDKTQNEHQNGEATHEVSNGPTNDIEVTQSPHSPRPSKATELSNGNPDFDGVPRGPRKSKQRLNQSDDANQLKKFSGQNDTQPQKRIFRILDALSATGLRALRYAKEIPFVSSVTANDLSSSATASIELNVSHNELAGKIHTITGDALAHMYNIASNRHSILPKGEPGKYDVIDLDPYGTAAPFLDAAVQAVAEGGLLCVTCTDSGVFASTGYLEKTFSQYGGLPFKGPQSHEAGLRLILHAIATSAARYGLAIEPLLSLSIDFYARLFVRVRRSPAEVKFLAGKTMLVYNCDAGCGAWSTQFIARNQKKISKKGETIYKFSVGQAPSANPNCEHCGFKTHLSGPMWGGPLHNPYFIQRILNDLPSRSQEIYATIPRIEGMLSIALHETILDGTDNVAPSTSASEETSLSPFASLNPASPDQHPFFIIPSCLSKVIHCSAPSDAAFRGALIHLGYRVTRSHCKPGSIRTNAPWSIIWEVMREWMRQKAPAKEGAVKPGVAGWGILQNNRSKIQMLSLKKDLATIIEGSSDLDNARTEIQAAIDRAGVSSDQECADNDKPGDTSSANRKAETSAEGETLEGLTTAGGVSDAVRRSKLKVIFDENLGREREHKRLVRYQMNPRVNWGPMNRAKGGDA